MDSATLVHDVNRTINAAGTAFMFDPGTFSVGEPLGIGPLETYFLGRGGVLGDVDAGVVAATFGVFEPGMVRGVWDKARAACPPADAATAFNEACAGYGRRKLAGIEGLDAYVTAAEQVVRAAPVVGLPLFAGWRAQPLADDAPGRAMQLTNVLREHRGSAHVCAIAAVGLSGAEAHLASKGEGQMAMMGWQEPWPDLAGLEDRLAEAEAVTDRIVLPAYEVLDDRGREALAAGVSAIGAAIRG